MILKMAFSRVRYQSRIVCFFDCHFTGDPVMPGCLGLDAMWQLLGFYLLDGNPESGEHWEL